MRRVVAVALTSAFFLSACGSSKSENTTAQGATFGNGTDSSAAAAETAAATTTTTSTTTTTTTIPPANTIPHGTGPITTMPDGTAIDPAMAQTAKAIYDAAVIRDYQRIKEIIGDRRFRWGFVGQRGPADQWKVDFEEGNDDALARVVALLDIAPTVDKRGNAVWPYLATKDPAEWNDADLAVLATLGYRPEDIEATKVKGIYKDFRLIISPEGLWTAFGVGY